MSATMFFVFVQEQELKSPMQEMPSTELEMKPRSSISTSISRAIPTESPPLLPTPTFSAGDFSLPIAPQTVTPILQPFANPLATPAPSTPSTTVSGTHYRFGLPFGFLRGPSPTAQEKSMASTPKPPDAKRIRHATDTLRQFEQMAETERLYHRSASNPEPTQISTMQMSVAMTSTIQQTRAEFLLEGENSNGSFTSFPSRPTSRSRGMTTTEKPSKSFIESSVGREEHQSPEDEREAKPTFAGRIICFH